MASVGSLVGIEACPDRMVYTAHKNTPNEAAVRAGPTAVEKEDMEFPASMSIQEQRATKDATTGWETYRNEDIQYEIKYPSQWQQTASIELPETAFLIGHNGEKIKIHSLGAAGVTRSTRSAERHVQEKHTRYGC